MSFSLKQKIYILFGILLTIFIFDQFTKNWAVQSLKDQPSVSYLGGLFQWIYAENPGAFLGMGGGLSREVRFVLFAVIVLAGLSFMIWYLLKKETSKVNLIAYAFILGGGFGNLWDRVVHQNGHVVDFMLIEIYGPLRTGVFNVADVAIMVGVFLALFGERLFRHRQKT